VELFEKAISLDPTLTLAYASLGTALNRLGQPERALEAYREAFRRDPSDPQTLWGVGVNLAAMGRTEEAVAALEKAVELGPDRPGPRTSLGTVLCNRLHRYEEGMAHFERAIALAPDLPNGYYNLAAALQALGRSEEAISTVRRAIEADPKFANAYVLLGNLLAIGGDPEGAVAALRRALELSPRLPAVRLSLGAALTRVGDWRVAGEIYEALLDVRGPDRFRSSLRNNLAWLLLVRPEAELRDPGRALELAREAVALLPEEPTVRSTLGLALYRCGEIHEAVRVLERTLELAPTEELRAYGRLILAMALHRLDRREEAAELSRRSGEWMDSRPQNDPDLEILRAEAEAVVR
jgi:tetratricopeptide (TPR) repeat protein